MPFSYTTKVTALVTVLRDYNSATSNPDLSAGLNQRITDDNIIASDPEVFRPRADRLPMVYVLVNDKEEDFGSLSTPGIAGTKKDATVNYSVIGIVGTPGGHKTYGDLLSEAYKIASNIEAIINTEYRLSNTCMYCQPISTQFEHGLDVGGSRAKAVVVNVRARYLYR